MKKPTYLLSGILVTLLSFISFGFLDKTPIEANELINKIKQNLDLYNHYLPQEKVYLQFDKPFYKPGDDIWFSAYLRNGVDLKASTTSEILHVELINPKGNVEKTLRLVAKNGSTHGDFRINAAMPGGMYKVKAYTNWMKNEGEEHYFEKELQVQAVVLPKLLMNLEFERKSYGAGEEVIAKLKLETLGNKPLSNHNFNFFAQLDGKEIVKGKSQTDKNGKAYARFFLPKNLDTNDGLLNVMIDYEGSQESISRSVPIILNNIDLQFFPEGGDLVQNVHSKIAFKALNEFGKPADVEGIILNERNEKVADFKSFHQGMGAFTLAPNGNGKYTAKITNPEGIIKEYILPEALSRGFRLQLNQPEKENIQVRIFSPLNTTLSLIAQVSGEIYFSEEINAKEGENTVSIPLRNFPAGVAQISLFDQKAIARCERLVFVNQHKQLEVEISTDKEKYLPREKVNLTLKVKDENGLPAPGKFSISVVDEKLISFADDKQAHILSSLLLSSVLSGKVEEPNFYFDKNEKKAEEALDYLLMTQGWRRFEWKDILEANEVNLKKKTQFSVEKAILKGKVIKSKDDQPVPNTRVTVLETEEVVYTDSEGKFEFKNLDLSIPRTLQVIDDEGKERLIQINDYAQEYLVNNRISGRVFSRDDGLPLPGVNVIVKGTTAGTITNIDGHYSLQIPEGGSSLAFSFIGYRTEEMKLAGKNIVNAELEVDVNALEEVVVIGFGEARKREFRAVQDNVVFEEAAEVIINVAPEEEKEEKMIIANNNWAPEGDGMMEIIFQRFEEVADEDFNDGIYTMVENMPEYPGGMEQLYKHISKNLQYPQQAMGLGIEGKVYVQFLVMEDGSLADVQVIKGVGAGCEEEAIRLISGLKKWNPGKQRGNAVKTRMVLPITYNLENYHQNHNSFMFQVASNADYELKAEAPKYYRARKFYSPVYHPEEKVETRTDFRQTIYWNPNILVDKTGIATVSFYNSDEVTAFRATVEGIADDGLIGRAEHVYFTQLPFSLTTKIPAVLAFEDKVAIPVTLKNNTSKAVSGALKIEAPHNLKLLTAFDPGVSISPNSVKTLFFDYEVLAVSSGQDKFKIAFESEGLKDSFEQPIEIKAKGFPATISFSGNESTRTFNLDIQDMVKNSLSASLTSYPDVLSDLMSGVESILREPYGCFEQTSSSTYPNVLALQYMENSGTINPEVREKALTLIDKGYKKLVSFETQQKGYEWFGNTPAHEGLTAYGLMEFKDMEKVYASVDNKMVERTTNWILDRRDGKGGFRKSSEALDQFGMASEDVSNAYIVYALSEAGYKDIEKELEQSSKKAISSNDAYQLALVTNALFNLGKQKEGEDLLKKLYEMMAKDGVKGWKADHSITRSYGKSLEVETASLVALSMLKSTNKDVKMLQETVNYLVQSRSNYGGFGSTQATILALKSLTEYAQFSKKTATSGTIEVLVDNQLVASKFYEKGTKGEIVIEGLEKYIKEDSKTISVKFMGTKDPLPYSVDISWSTYTPVNDRECKVSLETKLSKKESKVGETVRLTTTLKNTSDGGLPMTIALIGIPSGLSVQPWQLKELLDKKRVDFYEINKNYLILYYRQLIPKAEQVIHLDLKSEIPGNYEAPASSAYLYYTNEHKVWTGGERVVIKR